MTAAPMPPAWRAVQRLLAVRVDNMGDVLMTSPALAAIRATLPQVHLTLLTSPGGATLAPHLPMVDDTIAVRAPWVKHPPATPSADLAHLCATLQRRAFDAAIVFTTYTQSALPAAMLALLAHIPLRLAHARENPYDLLTDWTPEPEPELVRHEVERQLALVGRVGFTIDDVRLRFALQTADVERAALRLTAAGIDVGRPYVVVHPGATAESRRYPAERFGSAVRLIGERVPLPVVFTGGDDEADLVARARAHAGDSVRTVSLAGELSLGELAAVIGRAALLIGNNSGPAHVAAALGTPVVDLYALTNPQHTPWRTPSRVLYQDVPCRNCFKSVCPAGHHACLRGVSPMQVALAALELLGDVAPRTAHPAARKAAALTPA